tara:strand:- start:507 stop:623 length:117 start_codon:yes stop_codon:yes gene_type:complete
LEDEDKGYQVIEACNGEIGLEQATAEIPNIVNQYILGV